MSTNYARSARRTLCNRGQNGARGERYAWALVMIHATDRQARLARIEQLLHEYRLAKHRRLMRRAMRLWRKAEAHQQLARFEEQPERVH